MIGEGSDRCSAISALNFCLFVFFCSRVVASFHFRYRCAWKLCKTTPTAEVVAITIPEVWRKVPRRIHGECSRVDPIAAPMPYFSVGFFLFSVLLVLFSFSSHSSQTKQRNRQHSALQFHILSCFLLFSRLNCFCVSTSAGMRETNSERAFVHSLILPSRAQSYSFSKWATSHAEYNSIVVQVFSWILYLFIFWLLLFFWKYVYVWQHRQLQYVRLASLAGWVAELAPPSFKWHHVHGGEIRLETHCRREDGM